MPRRKQRSKGSGSVYRAKGRGWVAQRGRPPVDGKRRYERVYFDTRDQALGQVSAWEAERKAIRRHPRAADTVQAWCERWLTIKIDAVSATTLKFYARHLDYAIPYLGAIRLYDLEAQQIRDALAKLGALSPQSRKHVRTVLSMALQLAVDDGILPRNPCATVEPPKVEKYRAYALSDAELDALFAAVAGTRLAPLWHLLTDYGMRLDELLSARWADYDQAAAKLRIRATKNDRERYLDLTAPHVTRLADHWQALQDERESNAAWREQGYLFPSEVGTKLLQSNVRRAFKDALERAGLPHRIRIHDLRHTAATNLIAAGNDIPTVQYITGHRDSAVLLEIYAHHQEERNRAAVERVEAKRKKS